MPETQRLFVFRTAADAAPFNRADRPPNFAVLPFAVIPEGDPVPPEGTVKVHDGYRADFVRLAYGIDLLVRGSIHLVVSEANAIDVLNLSLGPKRGAFNPDDPLQIATRLVTERGIPVAIAAGNGGPHDGTLQPLALAPWAIAVGATDTFGRSLLKSSSRGTPGGAGPTVVADGDSHTVIVGGASFVPGTSFACAAVSKFAHWIVKCLELISADVADLGAGAWAPQSRPIRLPIWGLPDTGVASPVHAWPPAVQQVFDSGLDTVQAPRAETERHWYARVLDGLHEYGLEPKPRAIPDLVKHALQILAEPMRDYQPHEVGAGYVSLNHVDRFFRSFLPSTFAFLFCSPVSQAQYWKISETLDRELGPLWDAEKVEYTRTYFYYGFQIAAAKVI
jgi:hypothetical protein